MAYRINKEQEATLEQCRVAFDNVEVVPLINTSMAEYGYDDVVIAEGKEIFISATSAFDFNGKAKLQSEASYKIFERKWISLKDIYKQHREISKKIFRKEPETLIRLRLTGTLPALYLPWLECVKMYYSTLTEDAVLQERVSRLKITSEVVAEITTGITDLQKLRSAYLCDLGHAEDSTKQKDLAIARIKDWMVDFYAVADLALADHPQLLEALGRFKRS